jgi:predicted 3-demethylubiquinone-9 3-methyltransferase (glyoxalase superfamily)
VHRAPGDFPSGKKGDVLTVEFTVIGIPCLGLNGGPEFGHNEAFSFQAATALTKRKRIATGTRSSATAARRARAAGARTNGIVPVDYADRADASDH